MYKKRLKIKPIIEELKKGKLLYQAIHSVNISPATFTIWQNKNHRLKRLIDRARELCDNKRVGMVEDALFKNACEGNTTAQIFFLKNRCPEKYKDVQEIKGDGFSDKIQIIKFDEIKTTYEPSSNAEVPNRIAQRTEGNPQGV